jgi:uncharacterized protein (TIGR03435 family)
MLAMVFVIEATRASSVFGQTAEEPNLDRFVYEVISIRPDRPGGIGGGARVSIGDTRLEVSHLPLNELVHLAYGVEDLQIQNMPKWMAQESFSVEATVDPEITEALRKLEPDVRRAAHRHMLQTLLADRFHLVVREEKKELPVYVLTVAPNGAKLQPADPSNQYENGVTYPGGPLGPRKVGYAFGEGSIKIAGQGGTIRQLVERLNQMLSVHFQRPFVDETELKGIYDFELDFSVPWVTEYGFIPPGRDVREEQGDSLFSAIQSQLGLKLVSAKRPVPVITIEVVEHPTEN